MIPAYQIWNARTLAALVLLALPAFATAQGTADLSPLFPARGATATLTYDATGGPLAAQSQVVATVGFNGFQNTSDVTLAGTAPNWSATINIPADATGIDVVFKNPAGSIFDNNGGGGIDWHFAVAETQDVDLGATPVEGSLGGGYLFRVWAPDVSTVSVVGQFNSWVSSADLMVQNPATGVWTAHLNDAVTGQEYKFLLDGTEYRRDPRGRQVVDPDDNSVLVDPGAFTFAEPRPGTAHDFRDWVIYEMHVGTLDPAGGVAPGKFTDLIPGRLDYLQALNINAVHVMPVNEFPGSISGGYNLTEPFAIERDYGTPDEFRTFVEECHARGIAVIVDVVHNHYGPGGLDIYDFQDLNRNSSRDEPGIYFYDSPPELADTAFGPRPDYSETQVRDFISDSMRMFLQEYNIDGFRWDFVKAMRGTVDVNFNVSADLPDGISLIQQIHTDLIDTNPGLFSIAEDLAGDPRLTMPVASVSGNPGDGFGFDVDWDGAFHFLLINQLSQTVDANLDMNVIATLVNDDFNRLHYVESHDVVWELNSYDRTPVRIDPGQPEGLRARKMAGLGACLLLTTEGTPMIFQGSEILDIGGPNGDNSWSENEAIDFSRLSDPNISGFRDLYADLIALRRNLSGASAGLLGENTSVYHQDHVNKLVAYTRGNGGASLGDTVVVLANFSSTDYTAGYDIGLPAGGAWYELMNSDSSDYGSDFGDIGAGQVVETSASALHGFAQRGTVSIAPRSFVVLSQADAATEAVAAGNPSVTLDLPSGRSVEISFTNVTSAGSVLVQRTGADAFPTGFGDGGQFLDEYWVIEAQDGLAFDSADITFAYDESRFEAGYQEGWIDTAWRDDGGTVSNYAVTLDTVNNTATISAAPGFSTWYLGNGSGLPVEVDGFLVE